MQYVAIDFETASRCSNSACSIGLVRFDEEGVKMDEYYSLIKPPHPDFDPLCVSIHHIRPEDVEGAPSFCEIWNDISSFISSSPLVAHNAQFDMNVLSSTLDYYGIPIPPVEYYCTLSLSRKLWQKPSYALTNLAIDLGWSYDAHNALADAETAGRLFSRLCGEYLFDDVLFSRFMKRLYKKSDNPFPRSLSEKR